MQGTHVQLNALIVLKLPAVFGQEAPHVHFALSPAIVFALRSCLGHRAVAGDMRFGINHTDYPWPGSLGEHLDQAREMSRECTPR